MFTRVKLISLCAAIFIAIAIVSGCNGKREDTSSSGITSNTGTSSTETSDTGTGDTSSDTSTEASSSSVSSVPQYGVPSLQRPAGLPSSSDPVTLPEEPVSITKWDGPAGYVIVVSVSADARTLEGAEKLKAYIKSAFKVSLNIVNDSQAETAKEILFGKTNRAQSGNPAVGEYSVTVKEQKLVFDGGHWNTLGIALDRFMRENKKAGEVRESSESTTFTEQMLGKYDFVWSDEFEGEFLDTATWRSSGPTFGKRADSTLKWIEEPSILKITDGLLQMHAKRWFNPSNFAEKFAAPQYLNTSGGMNYTYGYLEMRAMIPYEQAAFPAWWLCNTPATRDNMDMLGEQKASYNLEIDLVEVFSRTDTFHCGIIQWPRTGDNPLNLERENWTFGTSTSGNVFENSSNLANEYHVYGFEWTPTDLVLYVDGVKKQEMKIADCPFTGGIGGFSDPLYIILDNNVRTPMAPGEGGAYSPPGPLTSFPKRFYVDYLRLYQKPGEGKLWTAG